MPDTAEEGIDQVIDAVYSGWLAERNSCLPVELQRLLQQCHDDHAAAIGRAKRIVQLAQHHSPGVRRAAIQIARELVAVGDDFELVILHGLKDDDCAVCTEAAASLRALGAGLARNPRGVVDHAVAMRWEGRHLRGEDRLLQDPWGYVVFFAALSQVRLAAIGRLAEDDLRDFLRYCHDRWMRPRDRLDEPLPPPSENEPVATHLGPWMVEWLDAVPPRPLTHLLRTRDPDQLARGTDVGALFW